MRVPAFVFTVVGEPKAQGSHRAIMPKYGTTPIVIESGGTPLKRWRRAVTAAAKAAVGGDPPLPGPLAVHLTFRVPRPQRAGPYPAVRPDLDKLTRAALDSMTAARVYGDDGQVVQLLAAKVYETAAEPTGLHVRVIVV